MKKTYTSKTIAWLSSSYGAGQLIEMTKSGESPDEIVNIMSFSIHESMGEGTYPWTRIGTAEITVTIEGEEELVANTVTAMRNEQRQVRADAEMKAQELEGKIQKLLAISYEPAVTE